MKFSYTALTAENKQVSGVFDVPDKAAAEAELHKMGVAIISLEEISDTQYAELQQKQAAEKAAKGIQTFTFRALDPNNKEVEGTIDALDEGAAFKRLITEYQFTVKNLYPPEATPEQQQQAQARIANLQAQFDAEAVAKQGAEVAEEKERAEEAKKISAQIGEEIDKVISNTKKTLEEHGELFSNDLKKEIDSTLSELELIRSSNNINHITEVTNTLYNLISNPDSIKEEAGQEQEYQTLMSDIEESALIKKQFDLYKAAVESTKVKRLFGQVTDKLKSLTAKKPGEEAKPSKLAAFKRKIHAKVEKLQQKTAPKFAKPKEPSKISQVFASLQNFLSAKNPVIKKAQKKELVTKWKALFKKKEKPAEKIKPAEVTPPPVSAAEATEEKPVAEAAPTTQEVAPEPAKPEPARAEAEAKESNKTKPEQAVAPKAKPKRDFTNFFVETDSFIGWLLSFYIIYFFIVNFSLEKSFGFEQDFIFKTLKTPLILNVTIFLLILHFTLRIRNLHFRSNFFGSTFLIFLGLGLYTFIVTNF